MIWSSDHSHNSSTYVTRCEEWRLFLLASQYYVSFRVSIDHFQDLFSSHWCRHSSCYDWQCNPDWHSVIPSLTSPVGHEHGSATRVLFIEVRQHHSAPPPTALADSTKEDSVQACGSCQQVSSRTAPSHLANQLKYTADFEAQRCLQAASSLSLNVSCTDVHRQWSGLSCCCCSYLEQSAPTCHVCSCTNCPFSKVVSRLSSSGIPSFLCHFQTLKSFFLLSYLLTNMTKAASSTSTNPNPKLNPHITCIRRLLLHSQIYPRYTCYYEQWNWCEQLTM